MRLINWNKKSSFQKKILMTFDDGQISDYDVVFPALIERRMKATFYIITDTVGEKGKKAIYWTRRHLSKDNLRFLKGLPLIEVLDNSFIVFHGSLHPKPNEDNYLLIETEVMKSLDALIKDYPDVKLCFFGHTHLSGTYEYYDGILSMTKSYNINLKPDAYYFLNPGSVGKSHNYKDTRASFLIFDSDSNSVEFKSVEFDLEECQRKIEQNGLISESGLLRRYAGRFSRYLGVDTSALKDKILR